MLRKYLVGSRVRPSSRGNKGLAVEVESDRARVMYSAAFRRLQRKTQVFPLEGNAAIRTRLTHSLEVAHVGRFIATSIVRKLQERKRLQEFGLDGEFEHAFVIFSEVACLLHDIGNPPFGHFGEAAISKWLCDKQIPGGESSGLHRFDGNPQGFRIITRLAGEDPNSGMNLTLTQLAASLKYQSLPSESNVYHKFGVFPTEEIFLHQIREVFELTPEQRHPLAYVMEAADDISYCLSDVEDAIEKGLISFDTFVEALRKCSDPAATPLIESGCEAVSKSRLVNEMVAFRANIINALVDFAADEFIDHLDLILSGQKKSLIPESSAQGELLEAARRSVGPLVFDNEEVIRLELTGHSVVSGLLDVFANLLTVPREEFSQLAEGIRTKKRPLERRLLLLMAPSHKRAYQHAAKEVNDEAEMVTRARLIVDYISGMTDSYAVACYKQLCGAGE